MGLDLLFALGIALALGARHAADPDHLVAVTALAASKDSDPRAAARLGAWWGIGHSATLVAIGIPLIAFRSELPQGLEAATEIAAGVLIVALAARTLWRWRRDERRIATPAQSLGVGVLHGLAGTGAVVVLLIATMPTQLEAALALAVFAPMSVVSMAVVTGAWAWVLTRPTIAPVYNAVLIPAFGLFGIAFGLWYVGH